MIVKIVLMMLTSFSPIRFTAVKTTTMPTLIISDATGVSGINLSI